MNSNSFSGADLEKALTEGALTQAQATLIGMVKPSEKSGHVSFSQAGCDTWVDLPTDMIERADQEGQRPCRDHFHPVMRITLKEPKDAQGKILLALLAQAALSPSEAQHVDELRTYPTRDRLSANVFNPRDAPHTKGIGAHNLAFPLAGISRTPGNECVSACFFVCGLWGGEAACYLNCLNACSKLPNSHSNVVFYDY